MHDGGLFEDSPDSDSEAQAVQAGVLRRMSPARKVSLVEDANRTSRLLALAGLRQRFPAAGEAELRRRLMDLVLGEELADRVYGPPPD